MEIRKVGVIGAGTMGRGIAAHLANAGVPVVLLDIVPAGANDRSQIARQAIDTLLKTEPAAFMHPKNARLVTPGNIEDDLASLADADWIVEAVIEDIGIKHDLYRRLEEVRGPDAVVSSNTSTIPLGRLVEGRSEAFRRNFLITHFFNPPRYMRLMELVGGEETAPQALDALAAFSDRALGKGVVRCNDTPGFIANRIGVFWNQSAINAALDLGLTVEEADAVAGRPMGLPRTGVFGLIDLVGLDLMPHLAASFLKTLPADDRYRAIHNEPPVIRQMIEDGYVGRKAKGGFYRINREGGGRVKEAIDLLTGDYRPERDVHLESLQAARGGGLRALVEHPDKGGQFAWRVLSEALSYTAELVPAIADDIAAVDLAMRLGYNWKHGPFELIDQLGPKWFADRLAAEGRPVPALIADLGNATFYKEDGPERAFMGADGGYQPIKHAPGIVDLPDIKRRTKRLAGNRAASLWDIGDGVACLELHTKMTALEPDVFAIMGQSMGTIAMSRGKLKALVIYSDSDNFSVGANLGIALFAINIGLYDQVEQSIKLGQQILKSLKYASFPVVAAPAGMALGGGCEILLHADAIQAHAETYIGLVEAGVGVVPGWGGVKEMIQRHLANPKRPQGPMPAIAGAFETIALAKVSKSAAEARDLLFLKPTDGITMNRERLLADAKAKALALVEAGYTPPKAEPISLPGPTAAAALKLQVDGLVATGKASLHDALVASHLARAVTGGDTDITETVTEDDLNKLEFEAFAGLIREPYTVDRIEHMLETGRPLRN